MQHEHYTHTAPDIPSSTALSIFFFLLHFLLMQLLFFLLVPFQDFLHSLLCSRPILHTGQFDQQITHDHSIMGTANDKSYDTTHDNLEDDTHQDIHQVSHQDSTPSAVRHSILSSFFSATEKSTSCRSPCMAFLPPLSGVFRLSHLGVIAGYPMQTVMRFSRSNGQNGNKKAVTKQTSPAFAFSERSC